ncbi:MAG: FG-GAP repeat protein [Bacteroidota bacterium]
MYAQITFYLTKFILRLVLSFLIFSPFSLPAQELSFQWNSMDLGSRIGISGLWTADLNQNGRKEIIAGEGFYFSVVSGQAYERIWTSKYYLERADKPNEFPISRIAVANDPRSGAPKIYVLLADGKMDIYDGNSLSLDSTHNFFYSIPPTIDAPAFNDLEIADLEGDSNLELIILTDQGVDVFDLRSLQRIRRTNAGEGIEMKILNVDTDAALEIIVTNSSSRGYNGYILDGVSYQTELRTSNGFGSSFTTGDIDGDGFVEIIANYPAIDSVKAFNPRTGTEIWSQFDGNTEDVIGLFQLPGDSIPYLYSLRNNFMRKLHPQSYMEVSNFRVGRSSGSGVMHMLMDDIDQDGEQELIVATGHRSTGSDHIYVIDPGREEVEWNNVDLKAPFYINFGDVDGDGQEELISNSFSAECGCDNRGSSTELSIYDPIRYQLKRKVRSVLRGSTASGRTYGTLLINADTDPDLEIVIGMGRLLKVNDYKLDTLIGERFINSANENSSIAVGDLEGDGAEEIVFLDTRGQLIVINPTDLSDKWSISTNAQAQLRVLIGQMDKDAAQEIILLSRIGISIYDGISKTLEWQSNSTFQTAVYGNLVDIDVDGDMDLIAADANGNFISLTTQPYVEKFFDKDSLSDLTGNLISNILSLDLGQGSEPEIIVQEEKLRVYSYPDFTKIYESDYFLEYDGTTPVGGFVANDLDNDGQLEIWLSEYKGIAQFQNQAIWATSLESSGISPNILLYPNPFSDRFHFQIELTQASPIALKLYSSTGQLIWARDERLLSPGKHLLEASPGSIGAGIYYLYYQGNDFRGSKVLMQEE